MTLNAATTLQNATRCGRRRFWRSRGTLAGRRIKACTDMGSTPDAAHPALQEYPAALSMRQLDSGQMHGRPSGRLYSTSLGYESDCWQRMTSVWLIAPGSDPANPAADSRPDDFSPRDHEGHGTAIASVIAGNPATGAVTISGMAPKAWLGNYRVMASTREMIARFSEIFAVIQALNRRGKSDGHGRGSISLQNKDTVLHRRAGPLGRRPAGWPQAMPIRRHAPTPLRTSAEIQR